MDVQTRCGISGTVVEVKLLLSANRKAFMLRRLAQQRMTLNV